MSPLHNSSPLSPLQIIKTFKISGEKNIAGLKKNLISVTYYYSNISVVRSVQHKNPSNHKKKYNSCLCEDSRKVDQRPK